MQKTELYAVVGAAWLACCLWQFKNGHTFMFIVSAVLSAMFFLAALYLKFRRKS